MARQKTVAPESGGETFSALSQWWYSNGKFVIAGLVIAGAGAGSWSLWQYSRDQHAIAAAERYAAFVSRLEEKKDVGEVVGIPELPIQEYGDTAYLPFAYLRRAKFFVDNDAYGKAAEDLRWVTKNSVSPYLSDLAYTRLARVLIILGEPDEALEVLDKNEFSAASLSLAEEVRGDVLISLEDFEGALKAYRAAWKAAVSKPELLRIKLELMGQNPDSSRQARNRR